MTKQDELKKAIKEHKENARLALAGCDYYISTGELDFAQDCKDNYDFYMARAAECQAELDAMK